MGVHGLWQLLQPTGKPITLESLEGKVLAVDVSIWLNQTIKGMRDRHGNPLANAHLLGLFHRICKLLYYRIKPIFVFDGGVPALKRQTLNARRQRKEQAADASSRAARKLLTTMLKQHAVSTVLGQGDQDQEALVTSLPTVKPGSSKDSDMFALPPVPEDDVIDVDEDNSWEARVAQREAIYDEFQDLDEIDIEGDDFKALPPEIQHEILTELKNERKKNSWAKLDELPEEASDFATYQISKLIRQSRLTKKLDDVCKELNSQSSSDVVADWSQDGESSIQSQRVISEDTSHVLLIKKSKQNKESRAGQETASSSQEETQQIKVDEDVWIEEEKSDIPPDIPSTCSKVPSKDSTSSQTTRKVDSCIFKNTEKKEIISESAVVRTSSAKLNERSTIDLTETKEEFSLGEVDLTCDDKLLDGASAETNASTSTQVDLTEDDIDGGLVSINGNSSYETKFQAKPTPKDMNTVNKNEVATSYSVTSDTANIKSKVSHKFSDDNKDTVQRTNSTATKITDHESSKSPEKVQNLPSCSSIISTNDNTNSKQDLYTSKREMLMSNEEVSVPERDTNLPTKDKDSAVEVNSDSEDDFIEISVDPSHAKPDDLFPASIFEIASPAAPAEKEEISSTEVEKQELSDEPSHVSENDLEGKEKASSPLRDEYMEPSTSRTTNEFAGMSQNDLGAYKEQLSQEQRSLEAERKRQERMASSVTDQMQADAQELLRLFGVPFIISPTEAEAQCAQLDSASLTQGTITDDSDIWLFGGSQVFKNFFNQDKYVEHYKADDIKFQLSLDRMRLILIALLCGSDYTDGVQGVGPITAMEVLTEFSGEGIEILKEFKKWWEAAQEQVKVPLETKVKAKLRHLELRPGFPSQAVVEAYLHPAVDESEDPFSWGMPNLDLIREYTHEKFGWNRSKTDDLVLPVLKKLNESQTQRHITSFFTTDLSEPRQVSSKRLKRVLNRMNNKEVESSPERDKPPVKRGRKGNGGCKTAGPKKGDTEGRRGRGKSTRGRGQGKTPARGGMKRVVVDGPDLSESSSDSE